MKLVRTFVVSFVTQAQTFGVSGSNQFLTIARTIPTVMSNLNPNQRQTYNREVQQSDTDPNGNTHTPVTHTTESVDNTKVTPNHESYRDGYTHGRVVEHNYQQANLVERDNNNAARGLLLGILLTSLTAFTAGAIWFFNQRPETPAPATAPAAETSPPPAASQPPERETTIIERETPVFIPVPQQAPTQPPANPQPEATAPPPPAAEPAPTNQTAPTTQPQTESNSTEPAMPSDPNASMPPDAGTSEQPSATPGNSSAPNDASNQGSSTP